MPTSQDMDMTHPTIIGLTALLALLLMLGVAGRLDFEEAMAQEAHYCEMVQSGAWPEFKNINCGDAK
jgi:hypothetical protein